MWTSASLSGHKPGVGSGALRISDVKFDMYFSFDYLHSLTINIMLSASTSSTVAEKAQ